MIMILKVLTIQPSEKAKLNAVHLNLETPRTFFCHTMAKLIYSDGRTCFMHFCAVFTYILAAYWNQQVASYLAWL